MSGKLYIVSTPIGNLGDITLRALEVLKLADLVLCEDTRETKKVWSKYGIRTPMVSYHAHSKLSKTSLFFDLLKQGKNLALVSDAGTPGISDPGFALVSKIKNDPDMRERVSVVPVPGASALTGAVSASGLPAHEFTFLGFLPHKKGREKIFREIAASKRTVVFYESPHRIMKTLSSLAEFSPDKKVCLAREMTKIHEEFKTGSAKELLEYLRKNPEKQRGEFTVLVS